MLFVLFACVSDPAPRGPDAAAVGVGVDVVEGAREGAGASALPPGALPESDLPFSGTGRWVIDGRVLTLAAGVVSADGAPVIAGVYDDPVASDDTLWVPADLGDGDGGIYAIRVDDGAVRVAARLTGGRPDRLVFAPDGATLLYVAGTTGITSLWRVPIGEGEARQITNVGVTRPPVPGVAPAGFVPPPVGAPPRFVGDRVVWTVKGVAREAAWR